MSHNLKISNAESAFFLWDIQVKVSTKMSKYTLYQIWSKKSWWSSFKVQFAQKTKTCWKIKKKIQTQNYPADLFQFWTSTHIKMITCQLLCDLNIIQKVSVGKQVLTQCQTVKRYNWEFFFLFNDKCLHTHNPVTQSTV